MLKQKSFPYTTIFTVVMISLFLLFVISLVYNPTGPQLNIFFLKMNDFFADFLNPLRYVAERDPYFNTINGLQEKSYFPLPFLIFYPFSQLDSYATMSLRDIWGSKIALMSAFVFVIFSLTVFIGALNQIRQKHNVSLLVFPGLFLTYIFFVTIERGNTIILSAGCVCFYLCNYDSDNKTKRILAAIALALTATLKIYPVLLGLLYFNKKQYREILISGGATLVLVFLPYLFFKGGFANIPQHIHNLRTFSSAYSFATDTSAYRLFCGSFNFQHSVDVFWAIWHYQQGQVIFPHPPVLFTEIAHGVTILFGGVSIILSFLISDKFVKTALIVLTILFIPVSSGLYCGLYLFPVFIMFLATTVTRSRAFNLFTLAVFVALLNPFQITVYGISINYLLGNAALGMWWLVILATSLKHVVKKITVSRLGQRWIITIPKFCR